MPFIFDQFLFIVVKIFVEEKKKKEKEKEIEIKFIIFILILLDTFQELFIMVYKHYIRKIITTDTKSN